MVVRWTFLDASLATPETYQFEVNPSEGGTPVRRKNVMYKNSAAPDGKILVFEGRDEPATFTFTGTIFTEAQYSTFLEWYEKRHQIKVTDDLGRETWIYITSFEVTRERSVHYPYKHRYVVEGIVLDWA